MDRMISRRRFLAKMAALGAGLTVGAPILAACAPAPTPQVIEKVVEKVVTQVVVKEVTKIVAGTPQVVKETVIVEKPVTKVVEKQVIKEVTRAQKIVALRFHAPLAIEGDWEVDRAKVFENMNPTVTLKVELIPSSEFVAKILSMNAAKTIGDAFWLAYGAGTPLKMAYDGVSRNVDEFITADKYEIDEFFPALVDAYTFEGNLIALPLEAHPTWGAFIFNQDLFDKAGLDYPTRDWTLDDVMEAAPKLTEKDSAGKATAWGYVENTSWNATTCHVHNFGGKIIEHMGKECRLSDPEGREAIQWSYDMRHKLKVVPTPDEMEGNLRAMFLSGKVAMTRSPMGLFSQITNLMEGKYRFGVVVSPKGPTGLRGNRTGGACVMMASQTEYPQEIWEYLKFICNPENGVHRVLFGAWPGGRKSLWEDPSLLRMPGFEAFAEAMANLHPLEAPWNLQADELARTFTNSMAAIWIGKIGAQEGIDAACADMQKVLDQPR